MKKQLTLITAMVLSLTILTPSAQAGSPQSHRWEGVAIGLGAAILGSALVDNYYRAPQPAPRVYAPPAPAYRHHRPSGRPYQGHWEIRKTWVQPAYEKIWNPGHFNRRGRWVEGEWLRVEKAPGYWEEERVWVARR
ncbi:MAG: hypothetical protein JEZ11_00350 [Desulfobacterales bacterium]|nr:hypothetical protein [Desulfobacterales bacterium]